MKTSSFALRAGSLWAAALLFAQSAAASPARPIRFERFSLEQGLSQSTVNAILQAVEQQLTRGVGLRHPCCVHGRRGGLPEGLAEPPPLLQSEGGRDARPRECLFLQGHGRDVEHGEPAVARSVLVRNEIAEAVTAPALAL